MKRFLLTLVVLSVFSIHMYGKIVLPSVFTDHMVLQQNSSAAIWGWAEPAETLRIVTSWNNDTVLVKANHSAKWSTSIKTIGAGGPYTIQILGSEKVQLNNVMLGEVWICSGQSNMEMSVNWKLINGEEEAAKANNPNIRIFHVQKLGAEYPQQDCRAHWTVSTPETMRATSAVGYFFARELQQKLNVPIGIIVSAWGGTPAEVWIEKNRVLNDPGLNKDKVSKQFEWWPTAPGTLYNSMIAPFIPYQIAGAIWYQGEANVENYQIYSSLMKTMVENWRSDFKKNFPFYLVQIAPYTYGATSFAPYLREQQELAAKTIPNSGMVVISDLVDDVKDIHPKNKLDVGKRLAMLALAETYKQQVGEYKSPAYESMKVEKEKIRLTFNNASSGLKSTGKSPERFMIAGEDKVFVPASAKIEGNQVVVSAKSIKNPVAVRFNFDDASMPDVFSTAGLPLAPFRTDRW
ncbi:MAG TPA: sialate O-acetylesterase [Prolixibacteraceae bacterium]|nr:sialate O-acetylesterase [Prolixibacteraceae bacterium]